MYELDPDSGLTDTYSTIVDGRSCNLHRRSFGHAWVPLYHFRHSAGEIGRRGIIIV